MTIECLNLESIYSKSLARPILSEVNLKINPGEFVVLLGLNGAGKSTLLRSLLGLTPVKRGEIKINNLTVTPENINQIRRHLGFISQGGGLVKQLSALDNVLCGCLGDCPPWQTLWGFPSQVQAKAIRLLTELGLQEQIHQKTSRLSGGQQQRVAIARALMQEPKILIADEPLAGLDVMAAQQVMEIFAKLHKEKGITIVMVLHDLGIASIYPERAIILDQGHIVYDGNCQHLQQKFSEFTYN